jgi:Inner membrane component of T3SS, cytoplasmic domain
VIRREPTRLGHPAESDVVLTFRHPAATVADLASALGLDVAATVSIDGTPVARGLPLRATDVRRGSVVTVRDIGVPRDDAEAPSDADTTGVTAVFRTVRGPDAGGEVSLRPGRYLLGRGEDADVRIEDHSVARRHAMLDVDVGGRVEVVDLAPSRPDRWGGGRRGRIARPGAAARGGR